MSLVSDALKPPSRLAFRCFTRVTEVQLADGEAGDRHQVLLDTFLVRTLLVPSIVVLFGSWNWWQSGLNRRAVPSSEATCAVTP